MRKMVFILAMVMVISSFAGCGSKGETVSMYDLRTEMEKADDTLGNLDNASSSDDAAADRFSYISDMDYSKVDSYFVSYSKDGNEQEIAVIAVKEKKDVKEALESLEKHKADREKLFKEYAPEYSAKVADGITFTSGNYAVLIICDKSDDVKKAFMDFTGKE